MYSLTGDNQQLSFFGDDILNQLDQSEPLLQLAQVIPWDDFEQAFKIYYSGLEAPAKPIRLMVGLLLLKQVESLSDKKVVVGWKQNPYYQAFCGQVSFSLTEPCHSTELVIALSLSNSEKELVSKVGPMRGIGYGKDI